MAIDAEIYSLLLHFFGNTKSGSVVTVLLGAVIDSERL
jgi:hypothetical protein